LPHSGVIDGGDIASVKYTAMKLGGEIHDQTCICHKLNNIIKRMLTDYFESDYLTEWRAFIKRMRQSNPFRELWINCCKQYNGNEIILQQDTETRWSSTISMMAKALTVIEATERMYNVTNNTEHRDFVPHWGDSTNETWITLGLIVEIFIPTAKAISTLEGQKYITQSLILLQISLLEKTSNDLKLKYPLDGTTPIKILHAVIDDLLKELKNLWDNLPIDTVIASMLDPRTKWFSKISAAEIKQATELMQKEYVALFREHGHIVEISTTQVDGDVLATLFGEISSTDRVVNPNTSWKNEINLYQSFPRPAAHTDPLLWWKLNAQQLPILSKLAMIYLAIPASQASVERIFSVAKNIITENRTSLAPDVIESLLFIRAYDDIMHLLVQH